MEIKISWSFFVERLREILRIPRNFFQKVEKEKGRDIALSYFSILLFIKVCLTFLEKTVIEPVGAGLFPSLIVRSGLAISLLVVTLVLEFYIFGLNYSKAKAVMINLINYTSTLVLLRFCYLGYPFWVLLDGSMESIYLSLERKYFTVFRRQKQF